MDTDLETKKTDFDDWLAIIFEVAAYQVQQHFSQSRSCSNRMKKRQLSQNARNGGEKRVRVSQLARSIGAVRLVRPPYIGFVGEDLQFSGSFWPSCSEEDTNMRYDMRVLEVIDKWQPAPGVSPQPGFKAGLVTSHQLSRSKPRRKYALLDHRPPSVLQRVVSE